MIRAEPSPLTVDFRSILARLSELNESVPLDALVYGIRRILEPILLPDRIPQLLQLLWNVDAYRRLLVAHSKDIQTWNEFYKNDHASKGQTDILTAEEEKMIKKFTSEKKNEGNRFVYCQAAIRWCQIVSWNSHPCI